MLVSLMLRCRSFDPRLALGVFFPLHVRVRMELDIKSGMPVPKGYMEWPHRHMAVGEYFEVLSKRVKMSSVYVANHRWGKRLGRKFICRREGDIVRVWRVA